MGERTTNPILVEVTRGTRIESVHRGAAAVVGRRGELIAAWGEIDRPVFVRSSAKPFQALALVESGAADHYGVSAAELAIACGSHGGEPDHVNCVDAWLARLNLEASALACGPHPPTDVAAAQALVRSGRPASAVHNNCSGKHTGFLAAAQHLHLPLAGYNDASHPLQVSVRHAIGEMTDVELTDDATAVDGCSAPIFALPILALALAYARLADPADLTRTRADALRRIAAAMSRWPGMVAGRGRFDTEVMAAGAGALIVKGGAEGVHAAAVPTLGLGIAIKIDDGANRAAEVAMAALLLALAEPSDAAGRCLSGHRIKPLRNAAGIRVGEIRPHDDWPEA